MIMGIAYVKRMNDNRNDNDERTKPATLTRLHDAREGEPTSHSRKWYEERPAGVHSTCFS